MVSLTTSNMFVENKINVNKDLVELESVDVGEGILSFNFDANENETTLVTEKDVIIDKEPIIHIDDLIKSNKYWLEDYMDK